MRRMQQEAQQYDVPHPSDEEALPDDESSSSEEEGEEKENTASNPQWTRRTHDIKLPPFTGFTGSCLPRHRVHTELGYVQCFITEELVATITANTIQYASLKGAPPGWTTTTAEMWRFIAVHIFMGIVDLPSINMYWEEGYKQEYVVRTFSRARFKELLRFFHIAEPTPPGVRHTVIDKIKPLHDLCLQTFPDYYQPPQEFTIDETMVRFKGRSDWKTVIKSKPTPTGYKVYTVGSHGYLLIFQVYRGKGGYATRQGIIHHTVIQLVQRWEGSNRTLFSDNLYTSPASLRTSSQGWAPVLRHCSSQPHRPPP